MYVYYIYKYTRSSECSFGKMKHHLQQLQDVQKENRAGDLTIIYSMQTIQTFF